MKFEYDTNLSEFMSDYFATIEGAKHDTNKSIAMMYIESCCTKPLTPTLAEQRAEVARLMPDVAYYRA
jgi:hypothetical protein